MHGSEHARCKRGLDPFSAALRDAKLGAQYGLRGGCPETYQNIGLDRGQFRVEPGPTGLDLGLSRFFVNAAFATLGGSPFEMLHGVGHIDFRAIDAGLDKCFIEDTTGGSNERQALAIFHVPRLLADKHDLGFRRAHTENGLRGIAPEIAVPAVGSLLPQ